MMDDHNTTARRQAHRNPPIFLATMLLVVDGQGAGVPEDGYGLVETYSMLQVVAARFLLVPIEVILHLRPPLQACHQHNPDARLVQVISSLFAQSTSIRRDRSGMSIRITLIVSRGTITKSSYDPGWERRCPARPYNGILRQARRKLASPADPRKAIWERSESRTLDCVETSPHNMTALHHHCPPFSRH